jgi:hypothetical protein
MCKDRKPDIKSFFTNLQAPMPFSKKIFLLARNNALKIAKRKNCCGNYGEPGC